MVSRIYNRGHYERVLELERVLHDLLPDIEALEACGDDCREYREVHGIFSERLANLKARFMTPPPAA